MLNVLRKKNVSKKIFWTLIILILPAFTIWGVGSLGRSGRQGPSYIGMIFGKKIHIQEFSKSVAASRNQLIMNFWNQPELLDQIARRVNINMLGWNRLVLLKKAGMERIQISDEELSDFLRSYPLFVRDGQFDPAIYERIVKYNFSASPREFEEEIRDGLKIEKLKARITKDVTISDQEVLEEYKKQNSAVTVNYVLVKTDDFISSITIDDKELEVYYNENKEKLKTQPQYDIEYLKLDPENPDLFTAAQNALSAKKPLEAIAGDNSLELKETGFFSIDKEIPDIGFSYEIIMTLSALSEGQTSDIIKVQNGDYYIIRLKSTAPPYVPDFEQVKTEITDILKSEKADTATKDYAQKIHRQISEKMGEGKNFTQGCNELGIKVISTPEAIKKDSYIPEIGKSESFTDAAFALETNKLGDVVKVDSGFCILSPEMRVPMDEAAFGKDKEAFAKKILDKKKADSLDEWFRGILVDTAPAVDLENVK